MITKYLIRQAFNIITHPRFDISDLSNDIAIIRLATYATFNNYVQPICLWDSTNSNIAEITGKFGTVIGWGVTQSDQLSHVLQHAAMSVVSFITCLQSNRNFYGAFLSEKNFCAGSRNGICSLTKLLFRKSLPICITNGKGTTVCNGDSGGSLSFEENGVYHIRGIVSLAMSRKDLKLCSNEDYVIFTDVAQYLHWIENVIPQLKRLPSKLGKHFRYCNFYVFNLVD